MDSKAVATLGIFVSVGVIVLGHADVGIVLMLLTIGATAYLAATSKPKQPRP